MISLTHNQLEEVTNDLLSSLKNSRDREIVALRYGLTPEGRQTLETIGGRFNITRERVRQIEKAVVIKLSSHPSATLKSVDTELRQLLAELGGVASLKSVAKKLKVDNDTDRARILFIATLAPSIAVVEDNDHFKTALTSVAHFTKDELHTIANEVADYLKAHGKPSTIEGIVAKVPTKISTASAEHIAGISKKLAKLEEHWGLTHWPQVNPKSIRDKTYLVLIKQGKPLHFTDIAERIGELGERKRPVTVQAVHNELIKDQRFVLVGRGIYALSEWGYQPGTVADIIADVLRDESPLHKDEIIKRVLKRRQVKTTTIVLNLQEKGEFVRVAKATYALQPAS